MCGAVAGIERCAASSSINLARAAGSVWMSESGPYARARRSFSSRSASGWVEGSSISRPHWGRERSASAMPPPRNHDAPSRVTQARTRSSRTTVLGTRVIRGREPRRIVCEESRIGRGGQASPARREPSRPPARSPAREAAEIRGRRPMRRTTHPQVQRTPAHNAPHPGSARSGHWRLMSSIAAARRVSPHRPRRAVRTIRIRAGPPHCQVAVGYARSPLTIRGKPGAPALPCSRPFSVSRGASALKADAGSLRRDWLPAASEIRRILPACVRPADPM